MTKQHQDPLEKHPSQVQMVLYNLDKLKLEWLLKPVLTCQRLPDVPKSIEMVVDYVAEVEFLFLHISFSLQ